MERLTSYKNDCKREMICRYEDCDTCEEYCPHLNEDNCPCLQEVLEKLAEYEDLEEQMKLLKLPCAVGDTVYYADNEYYFTVLPVKVDEISIMESSAILYKCLLFDGNGDAETQFDFDNDDFGKIVFLTRQEADDKLAEMEGKK